MSSDKTVTFSQNRSILKCECGEFEVDIFVLTDAKQQEVLDHAKTHDATSVHIIEVF